MPVNEPFQLPSGATAMSPGMSGVAGEDINSRCFVSYEVRKTAKILKNSENGATISLQNQLPYIIDGEKKFIPKGAKIEICKIIAGYGSDVVLRVADKLSETYSIPANEISKVAGKIDSEKYIFDVHWYEYKGVQYQAKLKVRREK